MSAVPVDAASTKEQLVLAAERLFAARGLDGVSMREIGAAAGSGNNSVVAYHFGSRDGLAQAIFEYRLPSIEARRAELLRARQPVDVRTRLECHVLPILEQGEQRGSHFLGFVAMLRHDGHGHVFDRVADEHRASTQTFRDQMSAMLPGIPQPLRGHRIEQALLSSVHAAAARERDRVNGCDVLPFAVHAGDLLDSLTGFLEAPVSPATTAALGLASAAATRRS